MCAPCPWSAGPPLVCAPFPPPPPLQATTFSSLKKKRAVNSAQNASSKQIRQLWISRFTTDGDSCLVTGVMMPPPPASRCLQLMPNIPAIVPSFLVSQLLLQCNLQCDCSSSECIQSSGQPTHWRICHCTRDSAFCCRASSVSRWPNWIWSTVQRTTRGQHCCHLRRHLQERRHRHL